MGENKITLLFHYRPTGYTHTVTPLLKTTQCYLLSIFPHNVVAIDLLLSVREAVVVVNTDSEHTGTKLSIQRVSQVRKAAHRLS